jgi:hypothetical protein
MSLRRLIFSLSLLAFLGIQTDITLAVSLSDQELRGQQIYRKGTAMEGNIYAYYNQIKKQINARFLPCVNCHGLEGHGKSEGGIESPDITWGELMKPYGHKHSLGRNHSAFDAESLKAAITKGVDPAGNPLDSAMPRYRMSKENLDALISYLKILGTDLNPGLTESTIKVGLLLSSSTSPLYFFLQAYIQELNEHGGIYGRKIELVFEEVHKDPHQYTKSVRRLIQEEEVFALFGVSLAEADGKVPALLKQEEMILITPLVIEERSELKTTSQRFSLFPGLIQQAQALTIFAGDKMKAVQSAVILPPDGGLSNQIWSAIHKQAEKQGVGYS